MFSNNNEEGKLPAELCEPSAENVHSGRMNYACPVKANFSQHETTEADSFSSQPRRCQDPARTHWGVAPV